MKFQAFIIVNMISAAVVTERIEDADSSSYLECIDMIKGEGEFTFEKQADDTECVIFFIADIDEVLELQLLDAAFDCDKESLELSNGRIRDGELIPHTPQGGGIGKEKLCSTLTTYVTTHNAAMLSIKFSEGSSFTISTSSRKSGRVCDAIIPDVTSNWETYEIAANSEECNLHIFYPVQISSPDTETNLIIKNKLWRFPHEELRPGKILRRTGHSVVTVRPRKHSVLFELKLRQKRSRRRHRKNTREN